MKDPSRNNGFVARAKRRLKQFLYTSGLLFWWHRRRNANFLTVAMFHRVLPPGDPRFVGADPVYTVTPEEFERCLELFERIYNIVSLDELCAACRGRADLPPRALLVTFDDGWQDNFQYGMEVLRRRHVPAVEFVATDFIGSERGFWLEEITHAMITGRVKESEKGATLIETLDRLPPDERNKRLADLFEPLDLPRRMADTSELLALAQAGVALGGHGSSHEPMTRLEDPRGEFSRCRERMRSLIQADGPIAFSFPHGRFNAELASQAAEAGFWPLFTSVEELMSYEALTILPTLGRLDMNLRRFRLADGSLDEAGLLFSMITRPQRLHAN